MDIATLVIGDGEDGGGAGKDLTAEHPQLEELPFHRGQLFLTLL